MDGRTEWDIIVDTLRLHELPPTRAAIDAVGAALADGYRQAIDELIERGRILPGADAVLASLADDPNVIQTVLTGNTRDVARIKLDAFGLSRYLDLRVGAYGDDARDRPALVSIARERVAKQYGLNLPNHDVVVLGDTPHDIDAALRAGARSIGVATGRTTPSALAAAGADIVVTDLIDTARIHAAVRPEHRTAG